MDTILDSFSQISAQSFLGKTIVVYLIYGKTINRIVNFTQSIEYNFLFSRIPGINKSLWEVLFTNYELYFL